MPTHRELDCISEWEVLLQLARKSSVEHFPTNGGEGVERGRAEGVTGDVESGIIIGTCSLCRSPVQYSRGWQHINFGTDYYIPPEEVGSWNSSSQGE